jgi:radical SAM superfamily enzyme YgiQ (UPF0313 family)
VRRDSSLRRVTESMRALLVSPRFPRNMWSYERALELIGRKVPMPPLSLATVAALLPASWELTLVDHNVRSVTEAEWAQADLVLLSAMTAQRADFLAQIREAKRRGKPVVVGGPYPTTLPDEVEAAGPDYLVLDEGEITIPAFLDALGRGEPRGRFSAGGRFADLTGSPVPRFDLLDLGAYDTMSVQFSRGCPFHCDFCDVTVIYGRGARTKTPAQLLAELDRLHALGWDRCVFVVDDNFIGHRGKVRALLEELRPWQKRHRYPFHFHTEASVDLAGAPDLLDLMAESNFNGVFLGIETPDAESLTAVGKTHNTRHRLDEAVETITRAGLRVMGGFIIGFDGEKPGAGERIARFVERTSIPTTLFSMLQALPHTALWHRLRQEGRLLGEDARLNPDTLMNFVPTRPLAEIAGEYVDTMWSLYDPVRFLDRTYRYFLMLGPPRWAPSERAPTRPTWKDVRALARLCWRQGVKRRTRWRFWHHLLCLRRRNPRVLIHYIIVSAHLEHFVEFRDSVRRKIESRLAAKGTSVTSSR